MPAAWRETSPKSARRRVNLASGSTVKADVSLAREVGQAIARSGHIVTSGATIGLPYYAAHGAKGAGGMSIGFSPAVSLREHLRKYRLPSNCFDFMTFSPSFSNDSIVTVDCTY